MANIQPRRQRHLAWEGCLNARDLGGLPIVGGGETRWQTVIRSDLLSRLTPKGRRALINYGVRTIIDLRSPKEAKEEPSTFTVPTDDTTAPTYLNLPIEKYYPHVSALISKATTRAEVYCIILDHYPDAMADAMRATANAQPGGVVIHCHSGTDRTGIVSALLLSLAGVPVEAIAADYAESQMRLRPYYEEVVVQAGDTDKAGFWSKPTATEEMMHIMLAHLDSRHGGVRKYLGHSGLSPIEMVSLKNRLCPS